MSEGKKVEVFQDLILEVSPQLLPSLRQELISAAKRPWIHSAESEADARSSLGNSSDFIIFIRENSDNLSAASLWMFADAKQYKVTNIVPREVGELEKSEYNALLQEFARSVASVAASRVGAHVRLTQPTEGGEDWFDPDTLSKLKRFSSAANKSSAAGHPMDRERWMAFLISAHLAQETPPAEHVRRWLREIGNWPEEVALSLTIEYESAMDLLTEYDQHQ